MSTENDTAPFGRLDWLALALLILSATTGAVAMVRDSHLGRVLFGIAAVAALAAWVASRVRYMIWRRR